MSSPLKSRHNVIFIDSLVSFSVSVNNMLCESRRVAHYERGGSATPKYPVSVRNRGSEQIRLLMFLCKLIKQYYSSFV